MQFLRNVWYMAAWSENVAAGKSLARTILNEPIVFFRGSGGVLSAFEDRCPHRGAPLSMGRIAGDRIICGYHGLEFDRTGMCVRNPHPSGKIPPGARVRTYPVAERFSAIWIWMGEKPTNPDTIPDFSALDGKDSKTTTRRDHMVMDASYELITDNLLDCSHTSFVHEGILGNEAMIQAPTEVTQSGRTIHVKRYSRAVPAPGVFDLIYKKQDGPVDTWTDIRWDAPGCMLLDVGVTAPGAPQREGTGYLGVHILTPETARSTHYHFSAQRWNPEPGSQGEELRKKWSDLRRFAFEQQDEPLIRAQQRIADLLPDDGTRKAVTLETDAGVIRWRRIMEQLIQTEARRDVSAAAS